jgi:hypothetical protein
MIPLITEYNVIVRYQWNYYYLKTVWQCYLSSMVGAWGDHQNVWKSFLDTIK